MIETVTDQILNIINHMKIQCWNTKLGKETPQMILDINVFERMGKVLKQRQNWWLKGRLSHGAKNYMQEIKCYSVSA